MKMKLNIIALLAFIGLVADSSSKGKGIRIEWSHITLLSVVAFLIGWLLFGLVGAIILAVIVMVVMGIIH